MSRKEIKEVIVYYGDSGLPYVGSRSEARLRIEVFKSPGDDSTFSKEVVITGNREGLVGLASAILGISDVEQSGFHIHIDEDSCDFFDSPEVLVTIFRDEGTRPRKNS